MGKTAPNLKSRLLPADVDGSEWDHYEVELISLFPVNEHGLSCHGREQVFIYPVGNLFFSTFITNLLVNIVVYYHIHHLHLPIDIKPEIHKKIFVWGNSNRWLHCNECSCPSVATHGLVQLINVVGILYGERGDSVISKHRIGSQDSTFDIFLMDGQRD